MSEPLLKEALSYEKAFANDDEMYRKYQQREDAIREEMTIGIKCGIKQGMEQGIKQGMQQGIMIGEERGERKRAEAMAKAMLTDGVDIKFIAKYTKLSIEEIKALE